MHEYSIAKQIIDVVLKKAEEHEAELIKEIYLEIGEMSMLQTDQLEFGLESLSKDTKAEGMEIFMEKVPVRIECEKGHVNEVSYNEEDPFLFLSELTCPQCGTKAHIKGGKECTIKRIVAE